MKKKILFRWLKVIILLYCLIGIGLYYGQEKLIFHPQPVDRRTPYKFAGALIEEVNLPYDKETNINIVKFLAAPRAVAARGADGDSIVAANGRASDTMARPIVLYFHGNKEGVTHYAAFAKDFTDHNYEVWMIDYPGFGKSTGKLTEARLYEFALLEYKLARKHAQPRDILIYGKSLGTGIATQLASVRDCRRLILECPYYSFTSLARHFAPVYPLGSMLHYRFPTNEFLPGVSAPVTIFHGDDDGLIPASNAERLRTLLKPGDRFITIPGAGHNNLRDFPIFRQTLDSLL